MVALIHHTDSVREYAYDRQSHAGRLDKALDEAHARDCIVGRHEAGLALDLSSTAVGE